MLNRNEIKTLQIVVLVAALGMLVWQGYSYYQQWRLHQRDLAYLASRAEFYATLPSEIRKPDINRAISDENIRFKRTTRSTATKAGFTVLAAGVLVGGLEVYNRRLAQAKAAQKRLNFKKK
ncbi:MAG: hypothetical protein HPY81_04375 [Firmicutes bacterium]|nr:hypothetical protein [Bacillota bacterium]